MWLIVDAFCQQTHKCSLLTPVEEGDSYQLADLEKLVSSLVFPTALSPTSSVSLRIAGYIGQSSGVKRTRKDSHTTRIQLHSVLGISPKEISCLHANTKGGGADSLHFYPVFFFLLEVKMGGWKGLRAREFIKFIKCATQANL